MQAHLACMLLLCCTYGALCTDVDQEQRALEDEILNNLFPSKMKHGKQSAPYWRVSLANMCRMVNSIHQETRNSDEEEEEEDKGVLRDGSFQLLEELNNLQHICQVLQSRDERLIQDALDYSEDDNDMALKRKSPYILKRQTGRSSKSRRPYILKRSPVY
ncbi:neurotensin/neuromedin N [Gouania willdenowi]|uniref:neurotensin/neuromedin N n=1 Tax=Gouania willdenowi TaxID=441366 RepID=UPI001054C1FB|nr:neurotensin/neuromedin N [Gouania willdenowi]